MTQKIHTKDHQSSITTKSTLERVKALSPELLQILASLVTLFAFFVEYSSLPAILGHEQPADLLATGILNQLASTMQIALILIGVPLFSFIDTWLSLSLASVVVQFLNRLGITVAYGFNAYRPVFYTFGLLILLPIVVGLSMIFMLILFGGLNLQAITFGLLSIGATTAFFFHWVRSWKEPPKWIAERKSKHEKRLQAHNR